MNLSLVCEHSTVQIARSLFTCVLKSAVKGPNELSFITHEFLTKSGSAKCKELYIS